jgi:MFS family permease
MSATPTSANSRRWWGLVVIAPAQLMIVLDATIVSVALPSIQHELGVSAADRQWVITAFTLAFGGLLLLGGRLADLVGRKRLFVIGLVGFAAASALGGASMNLIMLLAARATQGAFGALLAPTALSLLTTTFPNPRERGAAFAVFGAVAGGGSGVGLTLGGVLTEYFSWHWVLYVNVPIASRLMHRVLPRALLGTGLLAAAAAMGWLTRIGVDTGYPSHVLPSLIVIGFGLGLVFPPRRTSPPSGLLREKPVSPGPR